MSSPSKLIAPINAVSWSTWGWISGFLFVGLLLGLATELPISLGFFAAFVLLTAGLIWVEFRTSHLLFPETSEFCRGTNLVLIGGKTQDQSLLLLDKMVKYPATRSRVLALCVFLMGCLVTAITSLVLGDVAFPREALLFSVTLFGIAGLELYEVAYFDLHTCISAHLETIHQACNWETIFNRYNPQPQDRDREPALFGRLLLLAALAVLAAYLLETAHGPSSFHANLAARLVGLALILALLYFRRTRVLHRMVVGNIMKLLGQIERPEEFKNQNGIPLHSFFLISNITQSLNRLFQRLKHSERELAHWVYQEVDKSRFRMLGEMSGLVAHDLLGPLHVVRFCIEELQDSPDKAKMPDFMSQMSSNIYRSIDLLDSLRARLKNPNVETHTWTNFGDAHNHVVKLLATQFHTKNFGSISFQVDEPLLSLKIRMPRMDLTQVLDNLYRNCVDNLLSNKIANPTISLSLNQIATGSGHQMASIQISDNGTGLSPARFQNLTQYSFFAQSRDHGKSLGLKLTCRLVELNGGEVNVISSPKKQGTLFELKMICESKGGPTS